MTHMTFLRISKVSSNLKNVHTCQYSSENVKSLISCIKADERIVTKRTVAKYESPPLFLSFVCPPRSKFSCHSLVNAS